MANDTLVFEDPWTPTVGDVELALKVLEHYATTSESQTMVNSIMWQAAILLQMQLEDAKEVTETS